MTPHRLTANEKVTELATPIASAAILPSAMLLGVLVIGPPRLALVPLGGGSAHVIDLHLESPQEVALLSPDAALVRTADGAVWALGNLAGEPLRPKLVASDIRSLHARPGGAHALGVGVDGSATAFSISRGEVSARTFTARGGALRAADVDEHVTYVIAEGEGGGEFRIHPGATPELGTSARAALPREAQDLDRVRGGASLAVVFKRGETRIAAVTGGPRRFDAKLVHLGGKVADVAVIGASFAVIFVDGRAALYDESTIAGAGDGPLTPVSEIALGTRGRPRMLLAATIKGAPTLAVGTTSGELLSLSVGMAEAPAPSAEKAPESGDGPTIQRGAPAPVRAPEPEPKAAEPEPEPAPDFTARIAEFEAELDMLRKALARVESAGEQERLDAANDKARAIAEIEAAREQDRRDAAEAQRSALAEIEAAREKERADAAEAQRSALAAIDAEREKERADAAEEQRRALAWLEATREQERLDAANDKARAIAEIEAAREKERADAADDKARAIAEIEAAREKERADAAEAQRSALAAIDAEREKERREAAEDKRRALEEAADRAARELAATLRSEREEAELALSNRGREYDIAKAQAIRALEEQHVAALARAEQSHEEAHGARAEAAEAQKQRFDEEKLALEKALAARDEALAAQKQRFDEEQQALAAELETTAKRLGVEIDRAVAGEAELAARTQHLAREHAEVDELRGEIEKLREEAAQHKAEIDKLEDAVSRERERALTAERANAGVINVDRAKEKLGGVLDRVMTEIHKRR